MREETITLYRFEELEEEVQEKVLAEYWDINVDYEWWEFVFENAERIGLEIEEFDIAGRAYCKGKWIENAEYAARRILQEHGEMCETYKDAEGFLKDLALSKTEFEGREDYDPEYEEFEESTEYADLEDVFLNTLCEDYRIILESEYEYLTRDVAIKETIEANEWEFTEDGKRY